MIQNLRWSILGLVGFTIAAAVPALRASAAAPTQLPNRIAANEAAAIEALRTIAAAQNMFKAALDIDSNCDGIGEYGYLADMGGTIPMRIGAEGEHSACEPAGGSAIDILDPRLLRRALGTVTGGCALYHGYLFRMWLPDAVAYGIQEDQAGGKQDAPFPDPVKGAQMWCCYAWPLNYNHTGKQAFFINQRGTVLEYSNRSTSPWSGRYPSLNVPSFDEAYLVPNDMGSPLRIGIPNATGSIWWPVP